MTQSFKRILSPLAALRGVIAAFGVALLLAGCSSYGSDSSTSAFAGRSVEAADKSIGTARKDVKKAKRTLKSRKNQLRKLERSLKRAQKRIKSKRISKKRRRNARKIVAANPGKIRKAKRRVAIATRSLKAAKTRLVRAERTRAYAKRRQDAADARMKAGEKRREAAKARMAAYEEKRETQGPRRSVFGFGSFFGSARKPVAGKDGTASIGEYAARTDGGFKVAAIPADKLAPRLMRQDVAYRTRHKPGTIVVDTAKRYLYLVRRNGRALRYGIGVGKQGFSWSGSAHVGWKQPWPKWTPPKEMIARKPHLAKYCADCGGMPGGPKNPLGARALYLVKDGKDTLFRLHGTPEWQSIGTAASSGCIRLMNQDVIDLYKRVPNGTTVVVL